ncbi:MAG: FtsQ-type POTRA domain-containing protein [Deltaproteobacteria bacterium]|jgi:cell division protein FtsQ|nr:FtsQ-type POTRA domain-containing protein [Deltaproteobacteria bacterium]
MDRNKAKRPYVPLERLKVPKSGRWKERDLELKNTRREKLKGGKFPKKREGTLIRSDGFKEDRVKKALNKGSKFEGNFSKKARNRVSTDKPKAKNGSIFLNFLKASPKYLRKALSVLLIIFGSGIALILVTILLVSAYLYFSKSDFFTIKSFDIRGISKLTRAQILEASGLDRPVSAIGFDTVAAVRSLKSLPWIEDADISRTPPPDGVTIRVKEYKPKAIVNLDQLYYMDELGRPFKSLEPGENPDFPIISGFSPDELLNGGPLVEHSVRQIYEVMDILNERSDIFNLDNVSEINYDPDIGITLFMKRGGLEVRIGFGPYGEKIRRVGRVMSKLEEGEMTEGLIYLNLECPRRVTAKYLSGLSPVDKARLSRGEDLNDLETPAEM